MKNSRALKIFVLILLAIGFFALGYFRNYIFLTINERISSLYYNATPPPLPGILHIFSASGYATLIKAKWAFTLLFAILFGALSALTVYVAFKQRVFVALCIVLYTAIFIVSVFFETLGHVWPSFTNHGFNISRSLAHLEQSPILAIVILLAVYYYKKQ